MNDTDVVAFDAFLDRNWGIKPPKQVRYDEDGNAIKPNPIEQKSQEELSKEYKDKFAKMMNEEAGKFVGGIGHRNEEREKAAWEAKKQETEAKKTSVQPPKRRIIKSMFSGKVGTNSPKTENNDTLDK